MREWQEFLQRQEDEFGSETVDRWLRTLHVASFDACNLYLQAADSFQASWFDEHIRPKLSTFVNCNTHLIKVHLEVAGEKKPVKTKNQKKPEKALPSWPLSFDTPDPSFTFDTFIVSERTFVPVTLLQETCGKFVDNKLQAMSSLDSSKDVPIQGLVNPVFLYGTSGSGKSHLLQAFCQKLTRVGYNAVYVRAETFADHVVKAIRAGNMAFFRQTYRSLDALIVDDVQHLGKKNATQEEFFHTFNSLHTQGKMIILSGHSTPGALQNIEARLLSRFEWGISLELESLAKKDIERMLEIKAQFFNFPLPERINLFLAQTFATSPKSAVRALEALMLRQHLNSPGKKKAVLTLAHVKELLQDFIEKEKTEELSCERILELVSGHFGIPVADLIGKSQSRDCSVPRQLAMYLCRDLLKSPYMRIGDLFHRDHSTVMSGIRQIEKTLKEKDSSLQQTVTELKLLAACPS